MAVRYDVEPLLVHADLRTVLADLRADFQALVDLGFNGVVVRHLEDVDRVAVLNVAAEVGLTAVLEDRRCQRYLRTGLWPTGCSSVSDLARHIPPGITGHPAFGALGLASGPDLLAAQRARGLAAELRRTGIAYLWLDSDRVGALAGEKLVTIDAALLGSDADSSPLQRWLAAFHAGLSTGRSAGLVVDRHRRVPGDRRGLVVSDEPFTPAQAAAIRALLSRARHWGPRLFECATRSVRDLTVDGIDVRVTVLTRGRRRYAFVLNPGSSRYARGEITLPETIAGAAATRAVEVVPSAHSMVGRVIRTIEGQLLLPVDLRPGDAALFEIF